MMLWEMVKKRFRRPQSRPQTSPLTHKEEDSSPQSATAHQEGRPEPELSSGDGDDASSKPGVSFKTAHLQKTQEKALAKLLGSHFSPTELHELAFDIGIDYEDLRGATQTSIKALPLVNHCQRRGGTQVSNLLAAAYAVHPELDWSAVHPDGWVVPVAGSWSTPDGYKTTAIRQLLLHAFGDDLALDHFCRTHFPEATFDFGMGMSFRQKVQAFLVYCRHHHAFESLLALMQEMYPEPYATFGSYIDEEQEAFTQT